MTNTRRFIRDTVADNYRPKYMVELDRRMQWLDKLEAELKFDKPEVILSNG